LNSEIVSAHDLYLSHSLFTIYVEAPFFYRQGALVDCWWIWQLTKRQSMLISSMVINIIYCNNMLMPPTLMRTVLETFLLWTVYLLYI